MTQAVLPWCLQRYLVYGRRHHNTCPILPQSPPHGIAPGLMWLDGTWAARGRERDQVFIGRNGREREIRCLLETKGSSCKKSTLFLSDEMSHLHPYASRLVEVGPLPNQLTTEQINFDANFNQRLADESLIVLKQILRDQAGVVDGTLLA